MTKKQQTVDELIDDLSRIENGEDALFVIGQLDALASAILREVLHRKSTTRSASLPDVLRLVAKRAKSKTDARRLHKAARLASGLIATAEDVSYGYLPEEMVTDAENIRSELYELLLEWRSPNG